MTSNGERPQLPRYPPRLLGRAATRSTTTLKDLNRLHEAWTRPETIIVNEPWWTRHRPGAPISCSRRPPLYERERYRAQPAGRLPVPHARPHPARGGGSARRLTRSFAGLAERMGLGNAFTEGRDADAMDRPFLYTGFHRRATAAGISVPSADRTAREELGQARHRHARNSPSRSCAASAPIPKARRSRRPSGRIEIFSERIDGFRLRRLPPGHPVWLPPAEWPGAANRRGAPLHLVSATTGRQAAFAARGGRWRMWRARGPETHSHP